MPAVAFSTRPGSLSNPACPVVHLAALAGVFTGQLAVSVGVLIVAPGCSEGVTMAGATSR
jgi:hypothetical protein